MQLKIKLRKIGAGATFINPAIVYFPKGDDAPKEFVGGFQIHWWVWAIAVHLNKTTKE